MSRMIVTLLAAGAVFAALAAPSLHAAGDDAAVALLGARLPSADGDGPGERVDVVLRDGRVEALGTDLELPWDARAVDVTGLVLAPAFVDAAHDLALEFPRHPSMQGRPVDDGRDSFAGMLDANRGGLAPERAAWRGLPRDLGQRGKHREAGFGALLVAPSDMLLAGTGSWLRADDLPPREALLARDVAAFGSLGWRTGPETYEGTAYPATLMGVMAHLRQVLLDASRQQLLAARAAEGSAHDGFVHDPTLDALAPVLDGSLPLVLRADAEEDIRLALGLLDDFPAIRLVIAGGREAHELIDELTARDVGVLLDLDFGEEVEDPDAADDESGNDEGKRGKRKGARKKKGDDDASPGVLYDAERPLALRRDLRRRWVERVSGPARLLEAGVPVAFASLGRGPDKLLEGVATAVEHGGLSVIAARALLARGARDVLGESAPGGALEVGARVDVAAWKGAPLDDDASARVLVVGGRVFDLRDRDEAAPDDAEDEDDEADDDSEAEDDADGADDDSDAADESADEHEGDATRADADGDSGTDADGDAADADGDAADADEPADDDTPPAAHAYEAALRAALADAPEVDHPVELDSDREPSLRTGGDVLVRGATIHTQGPDGVLENADLLVRDGKIEAVGRELAAPEGVHVVDAAGRHVIPGILDAHAHVAIRGGINEWTRNITPEVTIEDEVDPDDVGIYRALAGGTTTARLLHGSANAIGGRHEIIKFRWGRSAPELVFEGAPRGVKFALGENPRQANWGSGSRFPKTRMGVELSLRRAFEEARRYRARWQAFDDAVAAGDDPAPPRRDLRLEALVGILDGDIGVHSHCYRADEILMLIRIAEDFGFKVQTFQHVLEGYKVAREIGAHGGLGCSTFIDWWGFKFEAKDAIPYNPALVHEAGVLMSINSDSDDHIRRLNLEAAKAVRYGGVPDEDALAMVTRVPAIQLGIADRVGSLEVGKDGDFAVFNGHPLDSTTRCELTFIDGELVFERRDGGYDAWVAEMQRRVEVGRAAAAAYEPVAPSAADARLAQLDERGAAQLALPRHATRAPSTPPRPAPGTLALVGGTVHTLVPGITGAPITHERGTVLLAGGRIESVSGSVADAAALAADGYEVIDVSGQHVWPGLVDGGGGLGIGEISAVVQSMDTGEIGGHQPDLRASTAWHPDSELIPVARVEGVTAALAVPGGSGAKGQSSLMALEGWTAGEAVVRDALALHVTTPRTRREPPRADELRVDQAHAAHGLLHGGAEHASDAELGWRASQAGEPLAERLAENWESLDALFDDAREYARVASAAAARGALEPHYDPRLEAMLPYVTGVAPVVFEADAADQIADALDFAARHGLRAVIGGGREAWKVADRLALADASVLLGPVLALPSSRHDPYDAPYANAAVLHRVGVRFGFRTNDSHSARDLPFHAAMAVAFGLPEDVALAALTSTTAEILGVDDELGRLAEGLRADVLVNDGSPLQIRSRVSRVIIGGRDVGLESKHTRLYEEYRGRLQDPGRAHVH